MEQSDLRELQKKFDEKKWLESEIARQDLTGKMFCCDICPYQDKYLKICTATEQFVAETSQCARMEIKKRAQDKLVITPRFSKPKEAKPARKRKVKKDADIAERIYVENNRTKAYALFDVTRDEVEYYDGD